jgi:hypothetical protein
VLSGSVVWDCCLGVLSGSAVWECGFTYCGSVVDAFAGWGRLA